MKSKWIKIVLVLICAGIAFIVFSQHHNDAPKKGTNIRQPYVTLYRSQNDKKLRLTLEDYIIGTVAAEMPASFEMEALKAQAVCARTYALNRLIGGKKYQNNADLSDDITCCQAYIDNDEFFRRHPGSPDKYLNKIKQAVDATRGQVMLYQGEPLDALYCSTCGGRTEDAGEAWGRKVPYLKGVACEYCRSSSHYLTRNEYSLNRLKPVLGLSGNILQIKILSTSSSGRVKKLMINGKIMSGEYLRAVLGLPSTWWSFQVKGDCLIINSRGYGHGIGMCQFGANGMAKSGYNYQQILRHYYQNFELHQITY